ncbi:MAG: flagellar capping protein FliD [Sulfurimonas sp.]|jgi:flagellar capping protein FliD|uniref:flagellar filament capping protein FliD n=1 Tax=Sulfurimonas sp. TaxID=2022749 RepID=UPI0039E6B015
MAGVNSLGIGSGVLTADLLDQLREADNAAILTPIETKLELSTQKDEAYKLLDGFMTTFKQSSAALGGESMYQGRQTSGSDDFVSVSAQSGSDLQNFNITEVVKAEKDVWNATTTFESVSTAVPGIDSGKLTVEVAGQSFEIDYTSATTLDDIRAAINDSAIDATATNLKIGDSAYSFSVSSDNLNEAITFTDSQQQEQLDTVKLIGNASSGDTYKWSDGVNELTIPLVAGETPTQTGVRITAAINDSTDLANPLHGLYTATATSDGFTIASDVVGTKFTGSSISSGDQLSIEAVTSTGFTKQLDTVTLTGNAVDGDTFTWSDGTNELTIPLVAGETPAQTATTIALAIQGDSALNDLYTVTTDAAGSFTMESKIFGLDFTSTVTSTGSQTSATEVSTQAHSSLAHQLDLNNIQTAKEASFKMNGISITRSTNTIDDLVNGVTITLNKSHGATDTSSLNVTQNDTTIKTEMELFVTNFNTLTSNLKDMTVYNQTTGVAGIFNSESFIKSIASDITNIINKTDTSGNSLFDYGVSIDKTGVMTFDNSTFSSKLAADPSALELLFRGKSAVDATETTSASSEVIGIFQALDKKMLTYTGSNKLLANFNTQLGDTKTNLISEYDKQKASLDVRYETLTKKFSAYDSLINKLNNQFASLKLLIDAESSDN